MQEIAIKYSITKRILGILGSLLFIIAGFWIMTLPYLESFQPSRYLWVKNPVLATLFGCVAIGFFGLILGFIIKTFIDNKPAILINFLGVTDSSSINSFGFVAWEEIQSISESSVRINWLSTQKFININLVNPNEYINKTSNHLKRESLKFNHRSYGSPIIFSANFWT